MNCIPVLIHPGEKSRTYALARVCIWENRLFLYCCFFGGGARTQHNAPLSVESNIMIVSAASRPGAGL